MGFFYHFHLSDYCMWINLAVCLYSSNVVNDKKFFKALCTPCTKGKLVERSHKFSTNIGKWDLCLYDLINIGKSIAVNKISYNFVDYTCYACNTRYFLYFPIPSRVLRRLVTLICDKAQNEAQVEALKKQAESATVAAKKLLEDTENKVVNNWFNSVKDMY